MFTGKVEQALKDFLNEYRRDQQRQETRRAERDKQIAHIDQCVDATKAAVTDGQHSLELRVQAIETQRASDAKWQRLLLGLVAGSVPIGIFVYDNFIRTQGG